MTRLPSRLTVPLRLGGTALVVGAVAASALIGGAPGLFVFATSGLFVGLVAYYLAERSDRRFVLLAVAGFYLGRQIFAMILHLILLQRGFDGSMFSDDYGYPRIAAALADHWRGDSFSFPTDPSVVNNYTRLAGILFWLVGDSTPALKTLNTAMGVVAAIFAYRTSFLLAGRYAARWTLLLTLGFPSIVLWSSLALKDPFALFALLGAVWVATEFLVRPSAIPAIALLVFAGIVSDARIYLPLVLGSAWLVSLALWRIGRSERAKPRWLALGGAVALLIFAMPQTATVALLVDDLGDVRQSMSEGARTAFVVRSTQEPLITVSTPTPTAVPTPAPTAVPTAAATSRPTSVVTAMPTNAPTVTPTTAATSRPTSVATALPTPAPTAVSTTAAPSPPVSRAAGADPVRRVWDSISFLPVGAAHVVAAPFPWQLRTVADLLLLPELLLWYLTEAMAFVAAVQLAARRRVEWAFVLATIALVGIALSLAEGNLGTLVRHRAMLIPPTIIVAGPALAVWGRKMVKSPSALRVRALATRLGLRPPPSLQ